MGFRERLRDEMDYQGISAKELSELTGISKRTIDNYLKSNPQEPGVLNAIKIAKALKVSVEFLALGQESSSSPHNSITQEEKQLLSKINKFSQKEKQVIIEMTEIIYKNK